MNREIKFRAWEPLNKKMHYMEFCLWEKVGNNDNKGFALPVGRQGVTGSYTIMNLDALEIMQYIGLKDKNGKEIYEGDIVKQNFNGKEWQGSVSIMPTQGTMVSGKPLWVHDVEVIGNIYENPELLCPPLKQGG